MPLYTWTDEHNAIVILAPDLSMARFCASLFVTSNDYTSLLEMIWREIPIISEDSIHITGNILSTSIGDTND